MARILGIDPGLRNMGWAIIEQNGQMIRQIAIGTLHSDATNPLATRLRTLYDGLTAVIDRFQPDYAAVEETFVNADPRATLKLGQARAIALLAPAMAGIAVGEYAANTIKKTVVGAGHADKAQIDYMVRLQIKDATPNSADAADALAIALTHCHLRRNMVGLPR